MVKHMLWSEILILIAIAGSLLYLRNYIAEKGKNTATKEDIGEITQKIEKIRSAYATDLERLRSSLQIAVNEQSAFSENKRQALTTFFNTSAELIIEKLSTNLGDFPSDQGKSLSEYQDSVMTLTVKLVKDYHRLLLYSEAGSKLPQIGSQMVRHAIEFRKEFRKNFGYVKINLVSEGEAYLSGDSERYKSATRETNEAARKYHKAIDPHGLKLKESFEMYVRELNEHFGDGASLILPDS